jgi:hypothetical protein
MTVEEHFIVYGMCGEAVKLLRFLLSPYSLIVTSNCEQKWGEGCINFCIISGGRIITNFENP